MEIAPATKQITKSLQSYWLRHPVQGLSGANIAVALGCQGLRIEDPDDLAGALATGRAERSYNILDGVAIRLQRIAAADIRPGATLRGETLAVLRVPLTLDNLEGVTARKGPSGETLITLISDDNFNSFQRTLLLVFALEE